MGLQGQILKSEVNSQVEEIAMNGVGHSASRRLRPYVNSMMHFLLHRVHYSPRQTVRRAANSLLCKAMRKLDAWLRQAQHIEEFTDKEDCVLRVSLHRATREIVLSDQTRAGPGELMGEIHLWNEHMLPIPANGADMTWGILMRRRAHRSLVSLARRVVSDPRFETVKVFRGKTAFGTGKPLNHVVRIARGLGFEVVSTPKPSGFISWWVAWGESIYLWAMGRTFSPGLSKDNRLVRPQWHELWMSRDMLLRRYGSGVSDR